MRLQAKDWSNQNHGKKVRTDNKTLDKLIANLRGVSHADATVLDSDDVLAAVNRTYPMSVLRAESITQLRNWANGRTVPA